MDSGFGDSSTEGLGIRVHGLASRSFSLSFCYVGVPPDLVKGVT